MMGIKIRRNISNKITIFNGCDNAGVFFILVHNKHVCSTLNVSGEKNNVFDWTKNCTITVKTSERIEHKKFELVEV